MKARKILIIVILTFAFLSSIYDSVSAQTRRKLMVAYVAPSISQSIAWVAKEAGIFAKHGIDADVILLTGSPRIIQTLLAGDIDYAIGGVASVLRARFRGADPVIVATTANFTSQQVLLRPDSPFQRLQDLKGKNVGVTQYGSQGDTFLRDALKKNGLKPDSDVTILQMGGIPQVGSALLAGKIDAGVTGESGLLLVHQGRAKQLPGGTARELAIAGSGATVNTTLRHIARDRLGVMRFLRAYVEGVHYFKTNTEGSLRALEKYFRGAKPEEIRFLYQEQRLAMDSLPVPTEEAIQAELDRETDPKAKTFRPADFMDLSFLREIEKSGFFRELYPKGPTAR